ncbi:MAG: ATP-binding cassette domain-containing protein [Anaerolineae bacterium]
MGGHALLGENGAGRIHLIKIMAGVYQPDAGEMALDGAAVRFGTREAQNAGIAAIYQEPSLFPDLDIAENILVGRQPRGRGGIDWKRMYGEASALLERARLALDPHTKARSQYQRGAAAGGWRRRPARCPSTPACSSWTRPTSSLPRTKSRSCSPSCASFAPPGTAIIFISHRLEELFALAGPGDDPARRPVRCDAPGWPRSRRRTDSHDGRPPPGAVPEAGCPGDVALAVEGLTVEGSFSDVSFELRRAKSGHGRAGRRWPPGVARAIFGIEPATAGVIKLDSKPVTIKSDAAMALGIGYVPEGRKEHGLVLPMSIGDNITLPVLSSFGRFGWLDRKREAKAAAVASQQLEVKMTGIDQLVAQLSRRQPAGSCSPSKAGLPKPRVPHPGRADARH